MRRQELFLGVVLLAAGVVGVVAYWHLRQPSAHQMVRTGDMKFEVVTDAAAQERGLGGRSVVPDHYGMLFVFPYDARYGFWMKDMLVPIDIVWLSDTGTVMGVLDSVATSTYPAVFYPPLPVRYVLETKAGFVRESGWATGTPVTLPLPYGEGVSK